MRKYLTDVSDVILMIVLALFSSSHPRHTLNSIPFSQFLRLRRLCSDDIDFNHQCDLMRSFFLNRNYPTDVVSRALTKVCSISRESALTPKNRDSNNRIPFTVNFHPVNLGIKQIIHNNFKLLTSDSETSAIFDQPPLFSFKRDRSIRNVPC